MNQNSNSIKTIIIVVLVLIAGYFIYQNYANRQAGQSGQITSGTPYMRTCKVQTSTGAWVDGLQVVQGDGTVGKCIPRVMSPGTTTDISPRQ